MKTLNLTTPSYVEEVILDVFDEDERFTRLTVIDGEENPATVTLNVNELEQMRSWIDQRLAELDLAERVDNVKDY